MKYLVADLKGTLLDAAVGKAEGWVCTAVYGGLGLAPPTAKTGAPFGVSFSWPAWSISWELGGPIIERERIDLEARANGGWYAVAYRKQAFDSTWPGFGPTPLIAAMRAFVAAKYGAEVELP